MAGKIHEDTQVGSSSIISFVIKKSPIKIFNFCATGAVAIIIAFSGFVHDLWPLFIGMFGLMTLLCAAEAILQKLKTVKTEDCNKDVYDRHDKNSHSI